jgi:hypothetical protein
MTEFLPCCAGGDAFAFIVAAQPQLQPELTCIFNEEPPEDYVMEIISEWSDSGVLNFICIQICHEL